MTSEEKDIVAVALENYMEEQQEALIQSDRNHFSEDDLQARLHYFLMTRDLYKKFSR